jgi:hypothetical protein
VLLGDRLEIGSEIESHAAYLGHWIELLKESPKVLFQVLSEERQPADLICPEAAWAAGAPGRGTRRLMSGASSRSAKRSDPWPSKADRAPGEMTMQPGQALAEQSTRHQNQIDGRPRDHD